MASIVSFKSYLTQHDVHLVKWWSHLIVLIGLLLLVLCSGAQRSGPARTRQHADWFPALRAWPRNRFDSISEFVYTESTEDVLCVRWWTHFKPEQCQECWNEPQSKNTTHILTLTKLNVVCNLSRKYVNTLWIDIFWTRLCATGLFFATSLCRC